MTVLEHDKTTIYDAFSVMRHGAGRVRDYADGRIRYDIGARRVYSYGTHFPLFHYAPSRVRGGRRPELLVLNGDRWRQGGWSSRTNDHQSIVRELAENACSAETVVIPFSALDGADIDCDSIRLVHVRPDANWSETREARSLRELPLHERTVSYSVDCESAELAGVPARYRTEWRAPTETELENGEPSYSTTRPRLPGADGVYRWSESRSKTRPADADGIYRWDVHLHRLGDALFSAVREQASVRPAQPFESDATGRNWSVRLSARATGADDCPTGPEYRHETGAAGACVHCGAPLFAREVWRRRALYLSSFDVNEPVPLYFLAEVPRASSPATVEQALDALAPRAVHAAMARGRHVARQGDIFFVDTDLTTLELELAGARFARLTLFSRDAKSRTGEIGYVAPATAAQRRRRAVRESNYARRLFSGALRAELVRDTWHAAREENRARRREENREQWRELLSAQVAELELARNGAQLSLAGIGAPLYEPCECCGAGIGEPCSLERLNGAQLNGRTLYPRGASADGYCRAILNGYRFELAYRHRRARENLRRDHRTSPGAYRAETYPRSSRTGRRALDLWHSAREQAQHKYRPETVFDSGRWRERRELVRRACAIYGTAHSATELAHVGRSVYVRGTVRHVPEIEPNRAGAPDHPPVNLKAGRLYHAIRNTVPRQTARRRRPKRAPA